MLCGAPKHRDRAQRQALPQYNVIKCENTDYRFEHAIRRSTLWKPLAVVTRHHRRASCHWHVLKCTRARHLSVRSVGAGVTLHHALRIRAHLHMHVVPRACMAVGQPKGPRDSAARCCAPQLLGAQPRAAAAKCLGCLRIWVRGKAGLGWIAWLQHPSPAPAWHRRRICAGLRCECTPPLLPTGAAAGIQ